MGSNRCQGLSLRIHLRTVSRCDGSTVPWRAGQARVCYNALENGLEARTAFDEGITPGEFEEVKTLNRVSAWKRENKHAYPHIE